jgi:HEAT repeat protein
MARGLYKSLNIEAGEETSVLLLIFQSIFFGIFYGAFDITAHALFLEVYPATMIPKAYIISGLAGIIMTTGYSFFQSRIRFSVFAIINLFLIVIITVLLRYGFSLTSQEVIVFVVFVMMGPLNIIALLGFWGTVGRIFTLRQGKRLFGLIDTGQIIGIIISSYAIPLLLSLNFGTRNLLLVSAASIIIALLLQLVITNRITFRVGAEQTSGEDSRRQNIFTTLKDRYIFIMSGFVVLLVIVTFFVHYTFITISKEYYPSDVAFAAFLGYFNGTLMIVSVLIKTFVYSKIMKTYGLKLALIISPLLLIVFTMVAAFVGGVFGFTVAASSFTLFFLLLSVSKLFAKTLHDSMVAPSMKILYQSLDARIRYSIQAMIDGTINEISALTSGIILAGLGALAFFGLVHYIYVLLGFLVVWLILAFRLYAAYKKSLNDSLSRYRLSQTHTEKRLASEYIVDELGEGNPGKIINALKITEYISFKKFKNALVELIGNASGYVSSFSLNKIGEYLFLDRREDIENRLQTGQASEHKSLVNNILVKLNEGKVRNITDEDLALMVKSIHPSGRIRVATYIFNAKEFTYLPVLNTLLRDHDAEVRKAAIDVATRWKVRETVPVLIDYLDTPLYDRAYDALIEIGEKGLEAIDQAFLKSGINELVLKRLTRVLGEIGTIEAQDMLLNKIMYHNRDVAVQALQSLTACNYQADEDNVNKIAQTVRGVIAVLAWNLAAEHTITDNNMGEHLKKAIAEEIKSNFDQMFNLLSIAYDPRSIFHIRQNLESGTTEGIGFAIELLDLFVAEELKPVLFPVLDDTNIIEKIKQLQVEFPIEILEPEPLLISIINRDPNFINAYTKGCALYAINQIPGFIITQDLIAQVFNPDMVLAELAAWHIRKNDPVTLNQVLMRLDPDSRGYLQAKVTEVENGRSEFFIDLVFRFEKVSFFKSLSGNLLLNLTRNVQEIYLKEGSIFKFDTDKEEHLFSYVSKGSVVLMRGDSELATASEGSLISSLPFLAVDGEGFALKAIKECAMLSLDLFAVKKFMFDYNEFALAIYYWMNDQIIHEKEFLNSIEMVS